MKKTKLKKAIFSLFAASLMLSAISCSNGDDSQNNGSSKPSGVPDTNNNIATDKADVAFVILSNLCDLHKYSPENEQVTDEDGNIVGGTETLPDGWESMQFEPDFGGFKLDENAQTVWSVGFADDKLTRDEAYSRAADWFFELIGEMPDTNNETYPEQYKFTSDVYNATLELKKSSEENLYATIDVSIPQLKKVTQIRCVPRSVIDSAIPDNGSTTLGYFGAGSVITDTRKGITWMCVRPAGGPDKKDKSHWISLSSEDIYGDPVLKYETKKVDAVYNLIVGLDDQDKIVSKDDVEWIYATNCMSFKTAKAAYHTFSLLAMGYGYSDGKWKISYAGVKPKKDDQGNEYYPEFDGQAKDPTYKLKFDGIEEWGNRYTTLKGKGIDIMSLNALAERKEITQTDNNFVGIQDWYEKFYTKFLFAYGAPKANKLRKTTNTVGNQLACVSYIQPMFIGITEKGSSKLEQVIATGLRVPNISYTNLRNQLIPYSVTDTFDEKAIFFLYNIGDTMDTGWGQKLSIYNSEKEVPWNPDKWVYDFKNYATKYSANASQNKLYFKNYDKSYAKWNGYSAANRNNVIFAKELDLNEKNGKNPLEKDKSYIVVHRFPAKSTNGWWNTLNQVQREVDGKFVKWADELKD